MLEQPELYLGPWTRLAKARRRTIQVPATGHVLGQVRAPLPTWLSWLGRQFQEVLESDDDSLVMTLWRPWGLARTWDVLDAEERRVGILFRNVLLDGYGRRVAIAQNHNEGSGRFCDPNGTELGTFAIKKTGAFLTFRHVLEGDPFKRMILLGAVLSWG